MNKTINKPLIDKAFRIEAYMTKEEDIILPNDNSFHIVGSKTGMALDIKKILCSIVAQKGDKDAEVYVHLTA